MSKLPCPLMHLNRLGVYPEECDACENRNNFSLAEVKEWLEGMRLIKANGNPPTDATLIVFNSNLEHIIRELEDEEDGLAAVTDRRRKG